MTDAPNRSRWRIGLVGLALAAYAALSIYSHGAPQARALGAALSIGPLLLLLLIVLWRSAPAWIAVGGSALTVFLCYRGWGPLMRHYEWSDLAQQVLIYALMAAVLARSLRPGQVPVLAQIADRAHGPLEADEQSYLRAATRAWALFYALIAVSIGALFFLVSARLWSIFTDVVVFIAIAAMVVIEHAVRRRCLRRSAPGGLVRALRQALIG